MGIRYTSKVGKIPNELFRGARTDDDRTTRQCDACRVKKRLYPRKIYEVEKFVFRTRVVFIGAGLWAHETSHDVNVATRS